MIVYENGDREVYKKKEVPAPAPPKVEEKVTPPAPVQTPSQREEPKPPAQTTSLSSSQMTLSKGYQHTGTHAAFYGGLFMPQSYDFEKKVDGTTVAKGELTNIDSKFKFVAQAVFQQDQLAFVFGGIVDSYDFGYMSFYYVGLNYYFVLDQFSPYGYLRAGYGLGKNDEPLVDKDEEISLTGPYVGVGLGCKIYLDKTWGLTAEFGYQYNSNGIDDKLEIFDRKRKYEFSADVSSLALVVGFFFYP